MHRRSIAWGFPPLVACILAASFDGLFRADARDLPEQGKSDFLRWTTFSCNPTGQQEAGPIELTSKPQKDHLLNAEKSSLEEGPKHTAPIAEFLPWAVESVHRWKKVAANSFLSGVGQWIADSKNVAPLPPAPLMPIPNSRQLAWQQGELSLFLHYGMNTYTDKEWGDGTESPKLFNPTGLNATQWAIVAKETGFKFMVIVAKHHDGFCAWPSRYTEHSVKNSPWKDGKGNVVREVADATRAAGIGFGIYLSPWDQNCSVYGDTRLYNEYYMGQLTELLTNYGPVVYNFYDGAKGSWGKKMTYHFDQIMKLNHQLQPGSVIFSDNGPDVRWVGNEAGWAGETNWATIDRKKVPLGGGTAVAGYLSTGQEGEPDYAPAECETSIRPGWFWHPGQAPKTLETLLGIYFSSVGRNCHMLLNVPPNSYPSEGEEGSPDYVPAECDTSIRPGWFYHPAESPKSVDVLLGTYFTSVGRNGHLILNVPPNRAGLFDDADIAALRGFHRALEEIFSTDFAVGSRAEASNVRGGKEDGQFGPPNVLTEDIPTYWATEDGVRQATLELRLPANETFNVVRLQEPIQLGQRISRHSVQVWDFHTESWTTLVEGTTIGHKRLHKTPSVSTDRVRVHVYSSRACPLLASFGLHHSKHVIEEPPRNVGSPRLAGFLSMLHSTY